MNTGMDDAHDSQRQVNDVGIHEIGGRLIDLGRQLVTVGEATENKKFRQHIAEVHEWGDEDAITDLERERRAAIRQTLAGLNSFRKDYSNWERLTVEYALLNGFTQRDVARLLGVGLSTVNRWAQHPLTYED